MPVVSRFYGIVIKMYFRQKEHNPPHVHAICGDDVGVFSILDGEMFEGDLQKREQQYVMEFISHYREELMHMWKTQEFKALEPI